MSASEPAPPAWSEEHSRHFIEIGKVYTPARDEMRDTLLDLIPAQPDDEFLAVELGVGGGWLSEAVLARFPHARVLGLDGSATMLAETASRLARFAGRFELRPFRLEDSGWRETLGDNVRCVLSSLVVHHLDGAGKRQLYRDLYPHLSAPGALLIADLIAPRGEHERGYLARAWEEVVRRQSQELTGSLDAYHQFQADQWNIYDHPDPMDMPSTLPEHLEWLAQAGYEAADVYWLRAGHAIYGGYRATY